MNTTNHNIDEARFKEAIDYRDNGEPAKAIQGFRKYIEEYPNDPKIYGAFTALAGVYHDIENFEQALKYFKRATELSPKYELASLGVYISYIELDKDEKAINELERYLDKYPAKLYRDTLLELLGDLKNGYATDFADTIRELADRHNISLDQE